MTNSDLVKKYFEYFNEHKWQEMSGLYSEEAIFKDPSLGIHPLPMSREEIRKKYAEMAEVFPDLRDDILEIHHSGTDKVVVEFVSRGTAPDGTTFELPICTVFTIEEGKITRDHSYYDNFEDND